MNNEGVKNNMIPTIRGMFVKSHCDALSKARGVEGVKELERRYGKPICFGHFENVPVREEVKIIEHVLDILEPGKFPSTAEHSFEAGRLHFRNFAASAFARFLLASLPKDFKMLVMRSKYIAPRIFRNIRFEPIDMGNNSVKVTLYNNDYPMEHFQGFFYEWMSFFGLSGQVNAKTLENNVFEYTIQW